ncbi:unnamed protein product [Blepharisma stoltei]|uniref:Uncharacterized protein n=1 Tax=Blepharisma stoltei TaxID=1481888 RepID=A0AAU9IGL0_9CILI|nr:unnamed protein product [Blepharisma stoltei]
MWESNWINEDEIHLINDCFLHEDERTMGLEKNGGLEGVGDQKKIHATWGCAICGEICYWMKGEHAEDLKE